MTRQLLCCLVFWAAGLGAAQSLLWGQEPTPVIPPPETSPNTSATKITEKPVAFTPLDRAQQLYLGGQFDEAVQEYNSIIRDGQDAAAAYAGMARAYLKLKKPDDAYAAASKAVELDPFLATAHSALGEVYFRQGQLYDAQTQFLLPFKTGKGDARSYLGLERLYRASFNFKRAKFAIDKAYELEPRDPDISGDWLGTRPPPERVKAMEALVASPSGFYSRAEVANTKHRLAVLKDQIEHQERTCRLAKQPESSELTLVPVDIDKRPNPFLGLQVDVNGQKSRLVVDTSAKGIVIDEDIAQKGGVQQIVRTDMDGLGQESPPESYVGFANSIKIGNLEFENCYLTVVERAAPGSFYNRFRGTIGARFFDEYLVDLDMPSAKLRLEPLPKRPATEDRGSAQMSADDPSTTEFHDRFVAPEMSAWTQLYQFGESIAIPTVVNESPPELFEVDTSGYTNEIAIEFAKKWAGFRGTTSPRIYSIDGKVDTRWSGGVRLRFAGFYFDSMAEPSFDMKIVTDRLGTEIYGALGFEVLHNLRTTIDYRDGLIHFDTGQERH